MQKEGSGYAKDLLDTVDLLFKFILMRIVNNSQNVFCSTNQAAVTSGKVIVHNNAGTTQLGTRDGTPRDPTSQTLSRYLGPSMLCQS